MTPELKGKDDIHTLEYCYIFNDGSSDIMVRSARYGYSKAE